jgi:hypothetical protein
MTIGQPITAETLAGIARNDIAAELRRRTMALGGQGDEVFRWPAHVKW